MLMPSRAMRERRCAAAVISVIAAASVSRVARLTVVPVNNRRGEVSTYLICSITGSRNRVPGCNYSGTRTRS